MGAGSRFLSAYNMFGVHHHLKKTKITFIYMSIIDYLKPYIMAI